MSGLPTLSVVVPVYRGGDAFRRCLEALKASEGLEPDASEVVVVVDGPDEASAETARRYADRTLFVDGGPRGPAAARNHGVAHANGDVMVFVDADVVVHPDTLRRIRDLFAREPDAVAMFGTYDDAPAEPGFLSQYRNLFHRYVHLRDAGDAETFWAGCGAIRARAFREAGGFDAEAFPRPQIEDIELGYRMRARGGRIILEPSVQGKHLKRWTMKSIVRTDLLDRGVPWMRLLIRWGRTGAGRAGTLSVKPLEKVKTAMLGLGLAATAAGVALWRPGSLILGAALLGAVVLLNWPVYAWFARLRGWGFAVRTIPLSLLYYLISGCSVLIGWTAELTRPGVAVAVPPPTTAAEKKPARSGR